VLYTAYGRRAAAGWRPAHILRRREADGLLLLGTQLSEEHLAEVASLDRPCVLVNREHPLLPWVAADRRQGTELATAHLLAHGRRRLGLLAAAYPGGAPVEERPELAGFQAALRAAGAQPDPAGVRFVPVGGDVEAATTGLLRGLLAAPGRTRVARVAPVAGVGDVGDAGDAGVHAWSGGGSDAGLVVFSYTLAPAAAQAVARAGIHVPDDLALIVGDEDAEARETLDVPLSAVTAPKFEMAQAAARLLLKLVRGEAVSPPERRQRFPMQLKVRWSCGARSRAIVGAHS
jgi:DNA-binding LacI/PurR family transcriptional regulator